MVCIFVLARKGNVPHHKFREYKSSSCSWLYRYRSSSCSHTIKFHIGKSVRQKKLFSLLNRKSQEFFNKAVNQGLNMELLVDSQSLFGLHGHSFTPHPPPPHSPRIWAHIRGRYWSAKIDDISLWPLEVNTLAAAPFTQGKLCVFVVIDLKKQKFWRDICTI